MTEIRNGFVLFYFNQSHFIEIKLRKQIQEAPAFIKNNETAQELLTLLFQMPIFTITQISSKFEKSYNTLQAIIMQFKELGFITEKASDKKRNKIYQFSEYLTALEQEY